MGNPINQTELAAWFEVNRTTVRQWQALGRPFNRQGREAIFDSAVAIH
jgi:phage terminase Nu1 subunit (DNA packaging protein)